MVISEPTAPVPARYRLIEEVGQGGMAVVYRAKDDSLKREVAIKVLHRHLSAEPESKARLEREAQAVAKLRHDNILEIFDYSGADAQSAFIVTELIHGQTLKQFLAGHALSHSEVAMLIAAELCGALVHAHGMGIIHRDVKPENVMIRNDGMLKLMDFGIAQVLDLERMTVTGQLLGSPAYMAPELVEGRSPDARTDVFSVGILLYQMATGVLPFSGKNPHEVLRRITDGRFPDPRGLNHMVGAGLSRILTRALARDPAARYQDMQALLGDLSEQLADVGLNAPRAELAKYFADPEGYNKALPERMTPCLLATAEKHLAARNSARAMDSWNRVLAYAPDHAGVTTALRRFQGRGLRRRIAAGGAIAAGATALAIAVARLTPASGPPTTKVEKPNPGAGKPGGIADKAANPAGEHAATTLGGENPAGGPTVAALPGAPHTAGTAASNDAHAGGVRPPHTRPIVERTGSEGGAAISKTGAASGSNASAVTRTFVLGPTPQAVDVYLDGERQFAYDTDHRSLTVGWNGPHQIEFRSPSGCCFVERIEVGPDRPAPPENIIARKLKWRPARLLITTQPAQSDARIMVRDPSRPERGVVVAAGEEANIPFQATDEGQKEIEVSVDAAAGVYAARVVVRAGEHKSVVVPLGRGGEPAAP